ncbi:MAG: TraX family protein [Alphaproteobacteria bacterium]
MSNLSLLKRLIPQTDGKALDVIKICAAMFMVIAQAHESWRGPNAAAGGGFESALGLAAFILFCHAQAMAMLRHDPQKAPRYAMMKYGMRLALLAVLVEPVSLFTRDITVPNVLFALTLGAVFSGFCRKLKPVECYAATVFLLLASTASPPFETGFAGVVLPAMLLLAAQGERPALGLAALAVTLIALKGHLLDTGMAFADHRWALADAGVGIALALFVLQLSVFAPQTGRLLPKYALHAFYPLQMLALWSLFRL